MNKLFLNGAMLLAAVSVWTSCQSEDAPTPSTEPAVGDAISFRIQGSRPSTYTLPTTVAEIDGFVVNGRVNEAGSLTRVLFDRKSVVRDAVKGTFTYAPTIYFPTEATSAIFTAFSPIHAPVTGTSGSAFTITDGGSSAIPATDNVISYKVPSPGSDPKGVAQQDLLVATTILPALSNTTVSFAFKHALSRVLVSVKNKTADPLIITKLYLVNLATEGTLDLDANTWVGGGVDTEDLNDDYFSSISPASADDTTKYKVLWVRTGEQKDTMRWLVPESGVAVPADNDYHSIVSEEQAMLVLPQITPLTDGDPAQFASASDFHLVIGYKLSNLINEEKIAFADINTEGVTTKGLVFEMGRQYNLQLEFNAGGGSGGGGNAGISFQVTVDPWEEPVTSSGAVQ
ncbi:MAG: fimbrillin family protein [Tannerella sp.]|jgi:hypothetical protein|nr:fimbrillin family protein [Tannerella sp.]